MSSFDRSSVSLRSVYIIFCIVFVDCKRQDDVNEFLFSGAIEFKDLSHPFDNDTLCLPGTKQMEFSQKSGGTRIEGVWFNDEERCESVYSGTHIDAPHYSNSSWSVGSIPFSNLITPLIVVDLNNYVAGSPDFILERRHMDYLFPGDARRNFTVLFRFGWSQYFGDKEKYLGGSRSDQYKYPGISKDVAEWISLSKNLVGVAVDTASVDPGGEQRGLARKVFTDNNVFMVENINLKHDLPRAFCTIIIMPMKFQEGTGAPCRVTTACPRLLGSGLF